MQTHTQKALHTCDKAIMRRFPVPTIIRIEFFSSISSGPFIRAGALLYRFRSAACRGRFCTHRNVHCAPDNRRQTFENCSAWRGDIGRGALPFLIHICRASYMRARPSVVTRSALWNHRDATAVAAFNRRRSLCKWHTGDVYAAHTVARTDELLRDSVVDKTRSRVIRPVYTQSILIRVFNRHMW